MIWGQRAGNCVELIETNPAKIWSSTCWYMLIHAIYFLQFGPTLSRVNPLSKDLAADVSMQNLAVRLASPTLSFMFLGKAVLSKIENFSNSFWHTPPTPPYKKDVHEAQPSLLVGQKPKAKQPCQMSNGINNTFQRQTRTKCYSVFKAADKKHFRLVIEDEDCRKALEQSLDADNKRE